LRSFDLPPSNPPFKGRDISRKGRRGQKKTSERLRGIFVII